MNVTADDIYSIAAADMQRAAEATALESRAANSPDYGRGLTAKQLEVLACEAKCFAVVWARRTGKTFVVPRLLLRAVDGDEGSWAVYITKTRKNAKLLLWKWLKKAAWLLGVKFKANETDLVMEVEGGGSILLGGADDIAEIEKYRQFGWKIVIVDEMGVHAASLLETLITDVIEPATADCDGVIVYLGTPGYVMDGIWYELSGPDSRIPVFHATAKDNTAVPGLWERILERKERNGWGDDHPTWLREYLAQWVRDASVLVYPYDDARNGLDGLPTHTLTGVPLNTNGWRYVLGVDVGFVHATAFALGACHDLDPRDFVIRTEKHAGMLPDEVIGHIRLNYLDQLPWLSIVVDAGGMGKIHERTMSLRGSMNVKAADKREKPDAVRDLRGRLLSGQTKILRGAQNDAIRGEYAILGWDDKHESHSKQQADDCADAVLYMIRELANYRDAAPQPYKPPTPAEVAAKIRHEHMKRHAPRVDPWASNDW